MSPPPTVHRPPWRALALTAALLLSAGCSTTPTRDAGAALIARPDFTAAAQAAPGWVRAALDNIATLEAELQKRPR